MRMTISDEFTLLKIVRDTLKSKKHSDVQLDSWDFDDCALIKIDEEDSFAITSDFVRGTGFLPFQRGYMSYYDVGWYLIGANLSDLASIWATPTWLTTAIRYSEDITDDIFTEIFKWMNDICEKYQTSIIWGDSWWYVSDVFCATAFWKVKTKNALLRKNVKDKHVVCVTGNLWDAVAAMIYLKNNLDAKEVLNSREEDKLFESLRRVSPRIEEWKILSSNFIWIAWQDISDGFKSTLLQMWWISWKDFTIYEDLLPISNEVKKIADYLDIDYLQLAFSASVDFELLITMTQNDFNIANEMFAKKWLSLIKVWEVNIKWKTQIKRSNGDITDIPWVEWKQQQWDFMSDIVS